MNYAKIKNPAVITVLTLIVLYLLSTLLGYIWIKFGAPISNCWFAGMIIFMILIILSFIIISIDPYIREQIINARKEAKNVLNIRREILKITELITILKKEILTLSDRYIQKGGSNNTISTLNEKLVKILEASHNVEYCPCSYHYNLLLKNLGSEGIIKDSTGYIFANEEECGQEILISLIREVRKKVY